MAGLPSNRCLERATAACTPTLRVLAPAIVALAFLGCAPDIHDTVGPRIPVADVTGEVVRGDGTARGLDVELRTADDATVVQSTQTDANGAYAFYEVPVGDWEVKVSGGSAGDFDAVSRLFLFVDADGLMDIPRMNIDALGAALLEPADSAAVARPNPFQALAFRWILPAAEILWARVQLYGADGGAVWNSNKVAASEILWNGIGNRGDLDGRAVPAGAYRWRVKFLFPDSLEARLDMRELRFE